MVEKQLPMSEEGVAGGSVAPRQEAWKQRLRNPFVIALLVTAITAGFVWVVTKSGSLQPQPLRSEEMTPSATVDAVTEEAAPEEALPAEVVHEPRPLVVVRFEGGEVSRNMGRLLQVAYDAIPKTDHVVQEGESVCRILIDKYKLGVGCSSELVGAIQKMNPNTDLATLRPGRKIVVPDIEVEEYSFARFLDVVYKDERRELDELEKHWNYLIRKKTVQPNSSLIRLDLLGFRVDVPMPTQDQAEELAHRLYELSEENTLIYTSEAPHAAPRKQFSSEVPVAASEYLLGTDEWKQGHEGWYSHDLKLGHNIKHECFECGKVCGQLAATGGTVDRSGCSEIVLIDSVDLMPNSEISPALIGDPSDPDGHDGGQCLSPSPVAGGGRADALATDPVHYTVLKDSEFDEKKCHPTHLAGIMVSQANGTGFAGLSSCSRLHGFNESVQQGDEAVSSDEKLTTFLTSHFRWVSRPLQVFVYTSEFEDYDERLLDANRLLKRASYRTSKNLVAQTMEGNPLLLIAAVGQPDSGKESVLEIMDRTPMAPQNLGFLANVIIVTACDDCSVGSARLWDQAHYSRPGRRRQSLVHVAAPGGDAVPALIGDTTIASMSGTSQATAFVGGVVASMINCYGSYYTAPHILKRRLLLTSAPVLRGEDAERVAGGIVDPHAARLDPTKDWLKRKGQGGHYESVKVKQWCVTGMQLKDPDSRISAGDAPPRRIQRLVKIPDRDNGSSRGGTVIYLVRELVTHRNQYPEIEKIGPGSWISGHPLVELESGEILRFGAVDDLILTEPVEAMSRNACAG